MATNNSTGSLMLPTKKSKADGKTVDADNEMAMGVNAPGLMTADQVQAEEERLDKKNHPRVYVRGNTLKTSGQQDADLRDDLMPGQYGKVPWSDAAYVEHAIRGRRAAIPAAGTMKPVQHDFSSHDNIMNFLLEQQRQGGDDDRRGKSREMVARIGDAISALSSMYQTTKGAPVTYQYGKDMGSTVAERNAKAIAERKVQQDQILSYLKVQAAKEAAEKRDLYQERKLKNEERRLDDYERETARREKRDELLERTQGWKEQYEQGLLDDKAERRRIDEAYKNELISLREKDLLIKELNATTAKRRVDISERPTTTERTVTKDDGYGGVETVTTSQTTYKGGSSSRGSRSSDKKSGSKQTGGLKPNRLGL